MLGVVEKGGAAGPLPAGAGWPTLMSFVVTPSGARIEATAERTAELL